MLIIKNGRLTRTYLAEKVYETILNNILSGTLASGAQVSEVSLAKDLNVSRTPVRQALTQLAKEGLIEQEGGRKPRIARFRREDIVEIYEMRLLLETAATERASERIEPRALAELVRAAEDLEAAPDGDDWRRRALDFDVRFHDALAEASGNARLQKEIAKYRLLVRAFCRMTGSTENLREALKEHRVILRAMEKKNPAAAREAMAAHICARLQVVLKSVYPVAS